MVPVRYVYIFFGLISILFVIALLKYQGESHVYVIFTVLANALLYYGFRRNPIFFDTFIGIFFWLGFWLKLTIRVAFMDGQFYEHVGSFDGSASAYDRALLVASSGFFGLLAASFLRERFVFTYPIKSTEVTQEGLYNFYQNHRMMILVGFAVLFVTVAVTNYYFGIYQRGVVPRTILPYGLGGIYSWLLLFGLASISALILNYEFILNKKASYPVVVLSLLEGFLSNVSLLSRGMILNTSALIYGVIGSLKLNAIKSSYRFFGTSFLLFILLFGSSVILVDHLRSKDSSATLSAITRGTKVLFLDRWVGIESVMAVSSYSKLGWDLWSKAWKETHSNTMSFYDANFIESSYKDIDRTKYHYISLPGSIAFFFYPGSFPFLFACMFILGAIAAGIEITVFKLGGGNIILCALLAQVVAYRYAHFGYLPSQSYLLFGALFLNLFIIYISNQCLLHWNKQKA